MWAFLWHFSLSGGRPCSLSGSQIKVKPEEEGRLLGVTQGGRPGGRPACLGSRPCHLLVMCPWAGWGRWLHLRGLMEKSYELRRVRSLGQNLAPAKSPGISDNNHHHNHHYMLLVLFRVNQRKSRLPVTEGSPASPFTLLPQLISCPSPGPCPGA